MSLARIIVVEDNTVVAADLRDEAEFTTWHKGIADHLRSHIKAKHADKTTAEKDAMMKQMRQMLWAAWIESRNVLRAREPHKGAYVDPRQSWAKHREETKAP